MNIEEELEREAWFEAEINKQKNIDSLILFKKGIKKRRGIPRQEKEYYYYLIDDKIKYLRNELNK